MYNINIFSFFQYFVCLSDGVNCTYLAEVQAEDENVVLTWWLDLILQVWLRPLLLQV